MKAENILKLPRTLWAKIGGKAATKIVKDSDKGFGTTEGTNKRYSFRTVPYTTQYASKKSAGKAGAKGVSTSKQTSPPNLQKPTNVGVDIMFRDGLKVKGNADRGRNIFGINEQNEKEIIKVISDYVGKNITKYASKPINISVG